MIEASLVTSSPVFFNGLDISSAVEEYKSKGTNTLKTLESILGPCPRIYIGCDMDAMLMQWDEKAEFSRRAIEIEEEAKRITEAGA